MKPKRVDWDEVFRKFDAWFYDNDNDNYMTWEEQSKKIRQLVEFDLNKNYDFKS